MSIAIHSGTSMTEGSGVKVNRLMPVARKDFRGLLVQIKLQRSFVYPGLIEKHEVKIRGR